jgi:hypothetical protein
MSPERSYVFSSGPLDAPLEHPPWAGGWHPEDLDELPHVEPLPVLDMALVDYTIHLLPDETCPYCCELRDTSECCGEPPPLKPGKSERKPIPVKENWRG